MQYHALNQIVRAHLSASSHASTQIKSTPRQKRCCCLVHHKTEITITRHTRFSNKDILPKRDCYCRLKMSRAMPTVHPLTEHTSRAKANIERIVFWVSALQPTDSCQLQAAGRPGLLPPASPPPPPPTCFPRHTGSAVRKGGGRRRRRRRRPAGREQPLQIQTYTHGAGMCMHARSLTHPYTPKHTHTISLFSNVPASLIHTARQEYKCKKGVIVKSGVELSAQLLRWSSLQSLKQHDTDTDTFQRHK